MILEPKIELDIKVYVDAVIHDHHMLNYISSMFKNIATITESKDQCAHDFYLEYVKRNGSILKLIPKSSINKNICIATCTSKSNRQ